MGHVNNAVYLTYLEAARFAWWRRAFGPSGLKEHGFIVARVEIDYRKPALPGERLLIRLRVDSLGRSSFTVAYEILNTRTREVVAEAKSVQVAYDYAAGSPCRSPKTCARSSRRPTEPVLIYGKDSCPYTADAREHYAAAGDAVHQRQEGRRGPGRMLELTGNHGGCRSSSRTAR